MNRILKDKGLFIRCNSDGIITFVHRNDFEIRNELILNKPFVNIFINEHISKALDFLYKIKTKSVEFGYELTLDANGNNLVLNFGGGLLDEQFYIIGSLEKADLDVFLSETMKISNEQTNIIRRLEKEKYLARDLQDTTMSTMFNELTKLNNELVSMQRDLAKKNSELDLLNRQKNEFIGIAAHDLRNPLNVIMNFSSFLLEEKDNLTEDQIHLIEVIQQQSHFMLNLISEILDVSTIESGKLNLEFTEENLIPLVKKCINYQKILFNKKNISIHFHTNQDIIKARIDKNKIEQVLNNLISNAFKYSFPGTKINVFLDKKDKEILFTVKDEGQGISANDIDKLFAPFQKASSRPTADEKSTGLGLFIVRKIIEGHNGKIWVESEQGKGSSFYFSLPCAD